MRFLILTASLPYPPTSGGALRSYGIIEGLSKAGHKVWLLSFHDGTTDIHETPLAQHCAHIETVPPPTRTRMDRLRDLLLSTQPDIARRMDSPLFAARLENLLNKQTFDWVQFEGIETVCYLPLARQIQPTAKLCFDTFNAEYVLQQRIYEVDRLEVRRWPAALYSLIQSRRIRAFEAAMCRAADCVVAVSPEDADTLRDFREDRRVSVVPNGISVERYTTSRSGLTLKPGALVFTGKMDYRPNVDAMLWFSAEILPRISGAHLYIVGQKPHPRLEGLRSRSDITLTGWVESVLPYLHAANVYVAPLRMGSGTRLKILEAMAAGCAVVATQTAASGLLSSAKDAMIVANTSEEIAQAIIDLLKHPDKRKIIGQAAQQAVRQNYDWSVLIPRLLEAYRQGVTQDGSLG